MKYKQISAFHMVLLVKYSEKFIIMMNFGRVIEGKIVSPFLLEESLNIRLYNFTTKC